MLRPRRHNLRHLDIDHVNPAHPGLTHSTHPRCPGHNITEKGVLFASIGVFVAVILGVVILTSILFLLFLYCCCCRRRNSFKVKTLEITQIPLQENGSLVQPSAPPVDIEDRLWAANAGSHMYTHSQQYGPYPLQHMPPPYMAPPPYQQECAVEVLRHPQGPNLNFPVK
ncbi:hypothetical protein BsWGS_13611 [Bradybaena similaris]